MSDHFSLVIMCDLREDAPQSCIDLVKWLCDSNSTLETRPSLDQFNKDDQMMLNDWDEPYLAPQPEEERMSLFNRYYRYTTSEQDGQRKVYKYALKYSEQDILDDGFYHFHYAFLFWLAPFVEEGFIGYYILNDEESPHLLFAKSGQFVEKPKLGTSINH